MFAKHRRAQLQTTALLSFLILAALFLTSPGLKEGGLWWDEAVYLGLAENLYTTHDYGVNAIVSEDFRAPALPVLITATYYIFGHEEAVARAINMIISVLVAITVFFTGKTMYNERVGFIASLFVITNRQYIFWGSKILSEPLAILLATLVLFSTYMVVAQGKQKYYYMLMPALALACLTRYPLGALGIAVALYALIVRRTRIVDELKSRHFWTGSALFAAVLLPWFIHNVVVYQHLFGSLIANFEIVQQYNHSAWIFVKEFMPNLQFVGLLALLGMAIGIQRKDRKAILFTLFTATCFFIFMFVLGQKEFRYSVITLPALALLAAWIVDDLDRRYELKGVVVALIVLLVLVAGTPEAYVRAVSDKGYGIAFREAGNYLEDKVPENSSIMTANYPVFGYLTDRYIVYFPADNWGVNEFIERFNISYVVVDSFNYYPEWSPAYFEDDARFVKEKVFSDKGMNVTIYRYVG